MGNFQNKTKTEAETPDNFKTDLVKKGSLPQGERTQRPRGGASGPVTPAGPRGADAPRPAGHHTRPAEPSPGLPADRRPVSGRAGTGLLVPTLCTVTAAGAVAEAQLASRPPGL